MKEQYVVKYQRFWNKYEELTFDTLEEAVQQYKELKSTAYEVNQLRKEFVIDLTYEVEEQLKGEIE